MSKVEIAVILDKSGSMMGLKRDAVGGFNAFLESQQKVPGEARLTLVLFSDRSEVMYQSLDIKGVMPLSEDNYRPGGMTALYDAVGRTIDELGTRLRNTPENERPDKVIVAILTDGEENSSRVYHQQKIKSMIEHQENVYNWEFLYLGANQDAFLVGQTIGIRAANTANFDATGVGTRGVYGTMDSMTTSYRTTPH